MSTFAPAAAVQPSSRATVAAGRPRSVSTDPGHSCSQPAEPVVSTISSSPSRSVAAPRPVRPASSPAGTGALSFGAHPGPNSTSIRRSSTASSDRDSAKACRRSSAFCARYIGITQHSRPVACPKLLVATFEPRNSAPRSSGSTACATVDCDTPSHRPSSAAQIDA
ncbi:hypothetical protein ACFWM0_31595 [Streptomyces sp. NPDC058405]|uniref:hypothetical protein n=1 Tax=Streptomyces sp. NPDC058405 TaxID=3346482 RepID=UPI00365E1FFC